MPNRALTMDELMGPIPDGYKEIVFDTLPVGGKFFLHRSPDPSLEMRKTSAEFQCFCRDCGNKHARTNAVLVNSNDTWPYIIQQGSKVMVKA